jgi:SSS family solute:Na+ symporter
MIKRVCALGWVFTGVILAAMVVQGDVGHQIATDLKADRELAFGTAMRSLLPHGMLGLMFAAIFASQMATLSAQMVNSSALAAHNLYRAAVRPEASDREVLYVGRICGLVLVAIGVFLAQRLGRVANALTMLLQFSSIMGVVVWGGVLSRRVNAKGAWAAVPVLFVAWALFGPVGMLIRSALPQLPQWIGCYGREQYVAQLMLCYLPVGVLTIVLVSLATKPQPRKQLDDFFLLLKTPVGQEQKLIDAGVPIVYAGSTTANPLEVKHPKLVHWGGFALAAGICLLLLGVLKVLAWIGSV